MIDPEDAARLAEQERVEAARATRPRVTCTKCGEDMPTECLGVHETLRHPVPLPDMTPRQEQLSKNKAKRKRNLK